jgi:hypothetical protein
MRLLSAAAADRRDPVNELYDCAGQLLQAARELNVAAARPGSAPAMAATLGCLEASLEALAQSMENARAPIHGRLKRDHREHSPVGRAALADLEVLRRALAQACRAARSARRAVGRLGGEAEVA